MRQLLLSLMGNRAVLSGSRMPRTPADLRRVYADIDEIRRIVDSSWQRAGIDALVCPVLATVALPWDYPMKVYTHVYTRAHTLTGTRYGRVFGRVQFTRLSGGRSAGRLCH